MTLIVDSFATILFRTLCNIKHSHNIVHDILLPREDDSTFDKSICISQQQHHYGLSFSAISVHHAQISRFGLFSVMFDLRVFYMHRYFYCLYIKNFAFCKH